MQKKNGEALKWWRAGVASYLQSQALFFSFYSFWLYYTNKKWLMILNLSVSGFSDLCFFSFLLASNQGLSNSIAMPVKQRNI